MFAFVYYFRRVCPESRSNSSRIYFLLAVNFLLSSIVRIVRCFWELWLMWVMVGRRVFLQIKTGMLYWENVEALEHLEDVLLIAELLPLSMIVTACQQ